ncbi:hypothetical protein EV363DRAFT_1450836 [Boletus edulis]|nr:hypothetical protein EV363DRAFT_1450836 [Boletus edulis]
MSGDRYIRYLAPWYHTAPMNIKVDDQSNVLDIVDDLCYRTGLNMDSEWKVAYLPKDVALEINPFDTLVDQLTAAASCLKVLDNHDSILSLDLCDKEDFIKVQFFIRHRHGLSIPFMPVQLIYSLSDQPEFILSQEEQDHEKTIEAASSITWDPLLPSTISSDYNMYQEDFLVQDGRPIHRTGPPITIYEEVFADIVDNLAHLSDIPDDEYVLAKTGEFC